MVRQMSRQNDLRFHDDVVLITGAASGIGWATARRFVREGAHVVATDIDAETVNERTAELADLTGTSESHELDVRDFDAVTATVKAVESEHGGLDVLVNGTLTETSREERNRLINVNINGVWNGCRAAVSGMTAAGCGSIVNVSSAGGLLGTPGLATYALTKAAVVNFTRALAGETGEYGVRVNAVCPGTIETPLAQSVMDRQSDPEAARQNAADATVLGRIGTPEEIAAAIAFLASDDASFVTGHALAVDGGSSAVLRSR